MAFFTVTDHMSQEQTYVLQTSIQEYGLRRVVLSIAPQENSDVVRATLSAKRGLEDVAYALEGRLIRENGVDKMRLLMYEESNPTQAKTTASQPVQVPTSSAVYLLTLQQHATGTDITGFYDCVMFNLVAKLRRGRSALIPSMNILSSLEDSVREYETNPATFAAELHVQKKE